MRSSDNYLVNVLDKLEETGLLDDTLIVRTADHGEMGLTHGGLRQKNFNFYEEATRVPLVYSNPKLFPKPAQTDALVSHVDFLPTLASLVGGAEERPLELAGRRLLRAGPQPRLRPSRSRTTSSSPTTTSSPARRTGPIRNRRTTSSASAKGAGSWPSTTTSKSKKPPQWEMYDLKTDPLEKTNLAYKGYERPPSRRSSSSGSNASSPGSKRPGCSRSPRRIGADARPWAPL